MDLTRLGEAAEDLLVKNNIPHHEELHGLIVAEEAGEVARVILKAAQGTRGGPEYWRENLTAELAGVIVAAAACAAHHGIDLELAVASHLADLPKIFANVRERRAPHA